MKSVSIAMQELKKKIDAAIVESGLPAAVLEPVLTCYSLQLGAMAAQQAAIDAKNEKEAADGVE